jgi:hypothetical protein
LRAGARLCVEYNAAQACGARVMLSMACAYAMSLVRARISMYLSLAFFEVGGDGANEAPASATGELY